MVHVAGPHSLTIPSSPPFGCSGHDSSILPLLVALGKEVGVLRKWPGALQQRGTAAGPPAQLLNPPRPYTSARLHGSPPVREMCMGGMYPPFAAVPVGAGH